MITPEQLRGFADRNAPKPSTPVPIPTSGARRIPPGICESPESLQAYLEVQGVGIKSHKRGADGSAVLILAACPFDPEHGHGTDSAVVLRADGKPGFECKHNGCSQYSWKDFRRKIDPSYDTRQSRPPVSQAASAAEVLAVEPPVYLATSNGLVWLKPTHDGSVVTPLANFVARIKRDVVYDDGQETAHHLDMEAELDGKRFEFRIPASRLAGMAWPIEYLGSKALIYPGMTIKDHARAAIQMLSPSIHLLHIYTHTGWRKIGDEWKYMHARGAIGTDGTSAAVEVHIQPRLAEFPKIESGEEVRQAVRASLGFLNVAPPAITVPLFAAIYRAPLGDCDLSVHLAGRTGTGKSEIATLAQQHFGAHLDRTHLPATWCSTANSLESIAFTAKDMLLVVDDFCPTGSSHDMARMHREADRLLRAQGNGAGRQRMRADATLQMTRWPRGLILSTGEDVPRGESLRARLLVLELGPNDIDWVVMTECQRLATSGIFALAMAGYLQWLAPRYEHIRAHLGESVSELRQLVHQTDGHKRTPTTIAQLAIGLRIFLRFAVDVGALTQSEADHHFKSWWNALLEAGNRHAVHVSTADPVTRFLNLLTAALSSGHAHVAGSDGARPQDGVSARACGWRTVEGGSIVEWRPQGDRIGWIVGDDLYLEPESAFHAAQKMAAASGEAVSVGSRTLWKRLHERGLLVSIDGQRDRLTVRRSLEGVRRQVLHFRMATLLPTTDDLPTSLVVSDCGGSAETIPLTEDARP